MEHVDIDPGAAVEDVVDVGDLRRNRTRLVRMAPVIEPAWPVFRDEERLTRTRAGKIVHAALVVAYAKVCGSEEARNRAFGNVPPVVRRVEQGVGEAEFHVYVMQVRDVGVVVAKLAVLVLDLRHQDWPAAANLQRQHFL